jgi:hypothetical protein
MGLISSSSSFSILMISSSWVYYRYIIFRSGEVGASERHRLKADEPRWGGVRRGVCVLRGAHLLQDDHDGRRQQGGLICHKNDRNRLITVADDGRRIWLCWVLLLGWSMANDATLDGRQGGIDPLWPWGEKSVTRYKDANDNMTNNHSVYLLL